MSFRFNYITKPDKYGNRSVARLIDEEDIGRWCVALADLNVEEEKFRLFSWEGDIDAEDDLVDQYLKVVVSDLNTSRSSVAPNYERHKRSATEVIKHGGAIMLANDISPRDFDGFINVVAESKLTELGDPLKPGQE